MRGFGDFGILWLNARNLIFIRKFNPKKNMRLISNKYKTKLFLEKRGIPVPLTYTHITNRKELFEFDFNSLQQSSFVTKPNKWSKGRGISIIKQIIHDNTHNQKTWLPSTWLAKRSDRRKQRYEQIIFRWMPVFSYTYKIGKKTLSDRLFKQWLLWILDGQHTTGDQEDTILVEEKIEPGLWFEQFCEYGLADIRVICFNMIPIAAMLRIPTKKSKGKANLAQWGIVLWIDMSTGKVTSLSLRWKLYKKSFPQIYSHFFGQMIPWRKDILLFSATVQYFLNIWFLWLDWVITPDGPKLLEANARSWLEIQNITELPLRSIMRKVQDITILTPHKWVDIALSLFSSTKIKESTQQPLYLSQNAEISVVDDSSIIPLDIVAVTNTDKKQSYMSPWIANYLQGNTKVQIIFPESAITTSIILRKSPHLKREENRTWYWFFEFICY